MDFYPTFTILNF